MKQGYKHSTSQFGTPAEDFVSRLFWLGHKPNGSRQPDLISVNGRYKPRLAVEVKSGNERKGVMVQYQLHYEIQDTDTFIEVFREEPPHTVQKQKTSFYYCVANRKDGLDAKQMAQPFASLRIRFGDLYMAPGDYCFNAFTTARVIRTGEDFETVATELRESMKRAIMDGNSHAEETKNKGRQTWQDLHGRDILAFFQDDPTITTKHGQQRIAMIREHYPEVDQLKPLEIPGPTGTTIYVLAKPEDERLIGEQLRKTVAERTPILNKIIDQRAASIPLIEEIVKNPAQQTFWQIEPTSQDLNHPEIPRLNRLARWLSEGEDALASPENEH